MRITPTHVPAIPKLPATLSPELRRYLEFITEALEIRLGRRGDPVDRAITLRELISSGLASELAATPFNPNLINSGNIGLGQSYVNIDVPPAVINFDAAGAYSQVNIFWTYPLYANHNQTEIWSHTTDSLGDATLAAVSTGRSVVDPIGGGETRYYWARHVSNSDVKGPFNSSSGTLAVTATNQQAILAELQGSISVSQLTTSLAAQIDGSGSAVDLANLETFVGFLGSYNVATAGSLLTRLGSVETSAAGLVTTYGNVAASAASAAAANISAAAALAAEVAALTGETGSETAKAASVLASAAAVTAQAGAESAETAAVAANLLAQAAQTGAGASLTDALAAKVAAVAAQVGAESAEDNAETAKTSAETAKAGAETAQTAASSSATSAAGSASTAGTSATTAATSATNAGSSATGAATSATTAATHATAAGTASSVATTAKLAA